MPLIKRGSIYYADLRGLGAGVVSTRCRSRAAAVAEYGRLEREAASRRDPAYRPPQRHPLSAALALVLARAREGDTHYQARCGHLERLLGDEILQALDAERVEGYVHQRRKEGAADATVHKEVTVLLRAMRLAARAGWWSGTLDALRPEWRPHMPPRERTLSPAEVRLLLPQLLPHRQLWLLVSLYTGGRQSAVEQLDWAGVDLEAGLLRLPGVKSRTSDQYLPIAPGLRDLLERVPVAARRGPVVGRWDNAWRDLDAARLRAELEEAFNLLDLRRSCASWLADSGATPTQVAQILGHTTTQMASQVYVKHAALALAGRAATLPSLALVPPAPVYGRRGSRGVRKPRRRL